MKIAKARLLAAKKCLCYLVLLCALFATCEVAYAETAADQRIIVVAKKDRPVHQELVASLQESIANNGAADVKIVQLANFTAAILSGREKEQADLIITVGTDVTLKVAALKLKSPILSVAIPRLSFDQLHKRYANEITAKQRGKLSAIFLDQPLQRRFNLIQQILPKAKRIGVVLGSNTLMYEEEISKEAIRLQLKPNVGNVTDEKNLIETLDKVLETSDLMLGILDPLVFNRRSSRNILLTTHRWRIPLIGISPAYVRAGALGAVYSTPTQIGQQLAETIKEFQINNIKKLSDPQYPKYFNVTINYQVAESLGIYIADEADIKLALSRQEQVIR